MDWNAIGAIGELVGAAGVIASLVYLGTQIRQNAESMRQAAADEAVQALVDWIHPLLQNPDTWDLFWRGCTDLDGLTERERARWIPMVYTWMKTVEAVLLKAKNGSLDPEVWEGWSKVLRGFNSHKGIEAYHDARRFGFTSAFNDWMADERSGAKARPNAEQLAKTLLSKNP